MKYLLILTISLLVTFSTYSQTSSCKKFRDGTFKLVDKGRTTIIERSNNEQLEYFNDAKIPTTYSISWIDDCTYILRPKAETFKKYPHTTKGPQLARASRS